MIKATINGKKDFTVEGNLLNGMETSVDLVELRDGHFHVIKDNKSYSAALVSFNTEEKLLVLNIKGTEYEVSIKDKNDLLLQQLGISSQSSSVVQSVKAPMPGLIINISVNIGDEVKKGDSLLILEAMKMENVIKSPRDGKIKKINTELRKAVEKNQVLLEFE